MLKFCYNSVRNGGSFVVKKQYNLIKDEILYFVSEFKKLLIPISILTGLYILSFSAILRANFNYIDDIGRVHAGYKGWEYYSRYLSNFLSRFFSTGNYLTDVSPLTQIVACVFLAVSGAVTIYVISGKTKFSVWQYISAMFFGITPFFLESISYKYDSPYMALSILAMVLPLFFFKGDNYVFYGLTVFVGTLAMCTTYQAASGIFPAFVALLIFKMWNECEKKKKILYFLTTSVAGYLIGLIFFRAFIMVPADNYASTSMPPLSQLVPTVINNMEKYYKAIPALFRPEWMILIVLLCMSFVYVAVRDSKRKKYVAFPIVLIILAFMFIICIGVYLALAKPIFACRARSGFGAVLALIAVFATSARKAYWTRIVSFSLCWVFVVFSFSYGNALNVQKEYTDYRISATIDDLMELGLLDGEETKIVQISGSIHEAPILRNIPQDYPLLDELLPTTYSYSHWQWGGYQFLHYYGLKNIKTDATLELLGFDLPVVLDNQYHTIKSDGKYILIELKS